MGLPDTFRTVVRPNVDTLYSIVFFDLRHEPMVLSLLDRDSLVTMEVWLLLQEALEEAIV